MLVCVGVCEEYNTMQLLWDLSGPLSAASNSLSNQ